MPCALAAEVPQVVDTTVIASEQLKDLDWLIERLRDRRLVFIGETHDRYEDHLLQLEILRGLHAQGKPLAIGLEMFQQPFQEVLDAYVAGEIDEAEMLRRSEYFTRWRFDYRHYRPILGFARAQGIPLVALNVPRELTAQVAREGLDALAPDERARLPAEIDFSDQQYRDDLYSVFQRHPQDRNADFQRFLTVQLLWDEGMAERAAEYLRAHSERRLAVLAGSGHLEYGRGIPQRVTRRLAVPAAIVLNGSDRLLRPGLADYLLFPTPTPLPPPGRLGVMLDADAGDGEGLTVTRVIPDSGAQAAGIVEGDRIVRLGDQPIRGYADIRIALIDSSPGLKLPAEIQRKRRQLTVEIELH